MLTKFAKSVNIKAGARTKDGFSNNGISELNVLGIEIIVPGLF